MNLTCHRAEVAQLSVQSIEKKEKREKEKKTGRKMVAPGRKMLKGKRVRNPVKRKGPSKQGKESPTKERKNIEKPKKKHRSGTVLKRHGNRKKNEATTEKRCT